MKTGVIILGHGSRAKEAAEVFDQIVEMVKEKVDYELVKGAAMELAEPTLEQSVTELVEQGVEQINIVPLFLFPGIHIQEDIPELIEELEAEYPEVQFNFGQNIGADEKIAEIVVDRIQKLG
ncbi:sirohydrochlorin chelatase [Halanaerobacter jeridensis]|uniref:Sirohydrochlorin ferrochelatase n=1 Tax=Halanaerobacter jeridensis TaxID=706427 RepID=A0A938XPK7_9FIRM|nr:CbiX/SirB N-terminal domain-containing protein [Halanaerobacter jeridensis]MBM7557128.1 sirohydrochlorin ferrochelatase [Halanaerobacter jeridensis]